MSNEYETSELIATAIKGGDGKAETVLVERYYASVLFILERRSGGADIAKDLCQETFRIMLERLRKSPLDEPEKLSSFLHRIAINLYIAEIRKLDRRQTYPDSDFLETVKSDDENNQYNTLLQESSSEAVRALILSLDNERDRKILYGFYVEEKDKEEICEELGLSNRHFDKVIFRARQRFKMLLLTKNSDF